jgi:hypothetical protein
MADILKNIFFKKNLKKMAGQGMLYSSFVKSNERWGYSSLVFFLFQKKGCQTPIQKGFPQHR